MVKLRIRPVLLTRLEEKQVSNWRDTVVEWWNSMAEFDHRECGTLKTARIHKKFALYLYGEPGSGKSKFIENMLSPFIAAKQIFKINSKTKLDKFSFGSFDEEVHRVSWIDEFVEKDADMNTLKLFIAGETLTAEKKNQCSFIIRNDYPVIISSQYVPPSDNAFNPEMGGRLFIVCCSPESSESKASRQTQWGEQTDPKHLHDVINKGVYQEPETIEFDLYKSLKSMANIKQNASFCPTRTLSFTEHGTDALNVVHTSAQSVSLSRRVSELGDTVPQFSALKLPKSARQLSVDGMTTFLYKRVNTKPSSINSSHESNVISLTVNDTNSNDTISESFTQDKEMNSGVSESSSSTPISSNIGQNKSRFTIGKKESSDAAIRYGITSGNTLSMSSVLKSQAGIFNTIRPISQMNKTTPTELVLITDNNEDDKDQENLQMQGSKRSLKTLTPRQTTRETLFTYKPVQIEDSTTIKNNFNDEDLDLNAFMENMSSSQVDNHSTKAPSSKQSKTGYEETPSLTQVPHATPSPPSTPTSSSLNQTSTNPSTPKPIINISPPSTQNENYTFTNNSQTQLRLLSTAICLEDGGPTEEQIKILEYK